MPHVSVNVYRQDRVYRKVRAGPPDLPVVLTPGAISLGIPAPRRHH
jgi:hypothetical protein